MKQAHGLSIVLLAFATVVLHAGCTDQAPPESYSPVSTPVTLAPAADPSIRARKVFPAAQVLLKQDGLHWLSGDQSQTVAGEFENLDARGELLSVLADGGHSLQLFRVTGAGIALQLQADFTDLLADEHCLYLSQHSGQLYAFVQDGRGASQQWLLAENGKPLADARRVRDIPVPYGTEKCAADDAGGWLYLAEQGVGVWRLAAEPEAMPERQGVLLNTPYGVAEGDITGLQVAGGDVLAISGRTLWRLPAGAVPSLESWSLPLVAPENLGARWTTDGLAIAVYDDEVGQLYTGTLGIEPSQIKTDEVIAQVVPVRETPAASQTGDAMDDPAIWVNPADPQSSRVLGTHKKLGLYVYDLQGNELQFLADGRLNNVDVRVGGMASGFGVDLAVASKREDNSIVLYGIDAQAKVRKLAAFATDLTEIYGICMGLWQGQHQVFVNDKDGRVQHYQLLKDNDHWQMPLVRTLKLSSQPEGCAFDDAKGRLFVGEERRGIWTLTLQDLQPAFTVMAEVGTELKRDVEGMAIASYTHQPSLLVVSSQGNDSYLLYEAEPPFRYQGRFRIGLSAQRGVDGSSETDGLDVTSTPLGADFPAGLLVVQDGRNLMPSEGQNFKFVSWQSVLDTLQKADQYTRR